MAGHQPRDETGVKTETIAEKLERQDSNSSTEKLERQESNSSTEKLERQESNSSTFSNSSWCEESSSCQSWDMQSVHSKLLYSESQLHSRKVRARYYCHYLLLSTIFSSELWFPPFNTASRNLIFPPFALGFSLLHLEKRKSNENTKWR